MERMIGQYICTVRIYLHPFLDVVSLDPLHQVQGGEHKVLFNTAILYIQEVLTHFIWLVTIYEMDQDSRLLGHII